MNQHVINHLCRLSFREGVSIGIALGLVIASVVMALYLWAN